MAIQDSNKIYPREGDEQIVYLKNAVNNPNIEIGDFTFYNDYVNNPLDFEKNNVLYHYPINGDKLKIGKFCSIACGVKFLFNAANHAMGSLSTYPFPIFYDEWRHGIWADKAWDNKGDIVIGNDVWLGYEAVILAGVKIGDGAIIGARAVVTKDVPAYTIAGGVPARPIRKRYTDEVIAALTDMKWWDWQPDKISRSIAFIQSGDIEALKKTAQTE